MQEMIIAGRPLRFTSAANVTTLRSCTIIGIICASSTSGTVKIEDEPVAAGTKVTELNTTTLVAGTFLPLYMKLNGQITITVGGTFDATLITI
jgi:hypothetical protein